MEASGQLHASGTLFPIPDEKEAGFLAAGLDTLE